jgi:hypothetical protein
VFYSVIPPLEKTECLCVVRRMQEAKKKKKKRGVRVVMGKGG